jgi:hypothetical protein
MYYVSYCPKCNIKEIIKHKKGSYCLIPILNYGKQFIKGFNKDLIWDDICDNLRGNDSYMDYTVNEDTEVGKQMRKVLNELKIKDVEVLFWVSW